MSLSSEPQLSTPSSPKPFVTRGHPNFTRVSSSPYARSPVDEDKQRDLTSIEIAHFGTTLGYPNISDYKAFLSKGGRWFLGTAPNAFSCFLDTPVPFGYILRKDGTQVKKTMGYSDAERIKTLEMQVAELQAYLSPEEPIHTD